MKRKVNRVGTSTLTVSLPSKWAREHGIEPGKEVEVLEEPGQLVIATKPVEQKKSITVDAPPYEEFAKRVILAPYVQGYNEITVRFTDPRTPERIMHTLTYLTGFEITAQEPTSMTLSNIAQGLEEQFDAMFFRLFHLVKLTLEALQAQDENAIREVTNYNFMIDKIYNFTRRLLNTRVQAETARITAWFRLVCWLEAVGDDAQFIVKDAKKHGWTECVESIDEVLALHVTFHALYKKPDTKKLAAMKTQSLETMQAIKERFRKNGSFAEHMLWSIAEKYRTMSEAILFPFKEHQEG